MTSEQLNIKVLLDISGVSSAAKQVKTQLSGMANTVKQSIPRINTESKKAKDSLSQVTNASNKVKKSMAGIGEEAKKSLSGVVSQSNKVTQALNAMNNASKQNTTASTDDMTDSAGNAVNALGELQDTMSDILTLNVFGLLAKSIPKFLTALAGSKKGFAAFKKEFKDIQETSEAWGMSWRGMWKEHAANFAKLGASLAPVIGRIALMTTVVIGLAAALTAVVAAINAIKISKLGKEMYTASQQAGFSAQAYQEWGYVLERVGIEVDELKEVMKTLTESQVDVIDGNEDIIRAYERLGMSAKEVAAMNQEELWTATIKGLQNVENTTERTSIAYKLFAEDTAKLTTLLNLNNQETQSLINTYNELSGGMSAELIKNSNVLQGSISNLKVAWQGLRNTLAQYVIPVLIVVVEWLTKVIVAINVFLRAFFDIDTTPMTENLTKGMNSASGAIGSVGDNANSTINTLEKLKRITMGFDELNIVSNPNTASADINGGGGGGTIGNNMAGLGAGNDFLMQTSKEAEEVAKKLKSFFSDYGGIIAVVAAAVTALGIAIKAIGLETMAGWVTKFFTELAKGGGVAASLAAVFPKISAAVAKVWAGLSGAAKAVGAFVAGLTGGQIALIAAIIALIASAVYFLWKNWDEMVNVVKRFIDTSIGPILEDIKVAWDEMREAVVSAGEAIWNAIPDELKEKLIAIKEKIDEIVKAIADWFKSIDWLKEIGKFFEGVGAGVVMVVGGIIAGAIRSVITAFKGLVQYFSGYIQIIAGIIEAIVKLFSGDLKGAWEAVKKIGAGILDVFKGLYNMTIGVIVSLVKGIIDWCVYMWDEIVGHSIIPDMVKAIVKWFKTLYNNSIGVIVDFASGIVSRFKNMWNTVSAWYQKNIAPKFTKSYWKGKFDTIKDGAKSAFNGVISVVESAVNNIISKINTLSWKIPDWVPKVGGESFGFSIKKVSIPRLATGGIAVNDTFAHIGEGGFREAVLPLDRNTGWMDELAAKLAARTSAPTKIVLNVDGKELGWATINNINAITKQTGGLQLAL